MTVEQAVIEKLIYALRSGKTHVGIHEVEAAHPKFIMSGRARLRGLRLKGLVRYHFDPTTTTYTILSSLDELYRAWGIITKK